MKLSILRTLVWRLRIGMMLFIVSLNVTLPGMAAPNVTEYRAAFEKFERAANGDNSAIAGAAQSFEALLQANPTDPLVMAYTGAATSMKAKETFLPWKKMSYVEDGTALLDKALSMLTTAHNEASADGIPIALETRFVVANTFMQLPAMFNRHERGVRLLEQVLSSPQFGATSKKFRGSAWMLAATDAIADKRVNDARNLLMQVIAIDAPQVSIAQTRLKALQK